MTVHIKICGITDVASALAAVEAGADALGFVFTESVREVSPEEARRISAELPVGVQRYAVFLRPRPWEVERVLAGFDADVVQADHGTVGQVGRTGLLPVFREPGPALDGYLADPKTRRRFHYEGRSPGSGVRADWDLAAEISGRGLMTLAGGLGPGNVAEAIGLVSPFGVDVSSGVESTPGVKDPGRIRDFVETVRELDREAVRK